MGFLESFRQAANSKLGSPIPSSGLCDESANQAENEFLKAMQDAKQEFALAKKQTGGNVDGAVDVVMGKIQEEEEFVEGLEKELRTQEEKESDDDSSSSSSFQWRAAGVA